MRGVFRKAGRPRLRLSFRPLTPLPAPHLAYLVGGMIAQPIPTSRAPGLLSMLAFGFAPRRFAEHHRARFGQVYRFHSPFGDLVFTSDPEHVRRIFSADSATFATFSERSLKALFGPKSVLLTWGPTHKRQRKLLSPPLTGTRLRAFGSSMQDIADEHVSRLLPGTSFRALDFTTQFTLDVIVRTVFGASTDREQRELREILSALVRSVPALPVFAPVLQQPWFPPWSTFLRARAETQHWLEAKIGQRRRDSEPGDDVLSLLLASRYDDGSAMADDEVLDQLLTLLLAGHETTAIALAHCLGHIHRQPKARERLYEELDATDLSHEHVQRLPYLSAVIDETLRLDPIVTDVARVPHQDFALDDRYVVTPRQVLFVFIEAIHTDPTLYPEPLSFRPERFLERRYAPHEYMPFGGGVRRCLGAAFSDYETKILLATLLKSRELRLLSRRPDPRVRRNITMGPKHGIAMKVERVRPS